MIKLIVYITRTIIVVLLSILMSSCQFSLNLGDTIKGDGNVVKENRPVSGEFTNIEVSKGIDVYITQEDAKSIVVEADKNIIDYITTDISDGTLKISIEKSVRNSKSRNVYVSMPNVENLRASSGASINSKNKLLVRSIDVKASSGSGINLTVETEKTVCETSSGSEIEIDGKTLNLIAESSSGSDIDAENLLSNEVTAKSSSGSGIKVHPIVSLDAKASSGSDIKYYNNPKTITKATSSGGSVRLN